MTDGYVGLDIHHTNSAGASIGLNGDGLYLERGELLDWSYVTSTLNGLLVDLLPSTEPRPATIHVVGDTEAQAEERFNLLANHVAVDRAAFRHGRLYVGEWYFPCIFVASSKQYRQDRTVITQKYSLYSDNPMWTREKAFGFASVERDLDGLDMGHDYPHDYTAPWFSGQAINSCPYPCKARITVEGPAEGWSVRVGENVYQCDAKLDAGEFLTMDGMEETIVKTTALGNVEDAFSTRMGVYSEGSGSFVFEEVPPGASSVFWNNCKAVEVVLYEQVDELPMSVAS